MVWFSYHGGHSGQFCGHAQNTLREVVERAVQLGFTTFGLSEHCPRLRQRDLYAEESALTPSRLQTHFSAYIVEARKLQAEFADRIELLVGFETEALPEDTWPAAMADIAAQHPFDFFIGSVHSVNGTYVDYKPELTQNLEHSLGGWDNLCIAYFDEVAKLVGTLRPPVVGHIDLVRRFKSEGFEFSERVWPHIERALEVVRSVGALLELNATPFRKGFGPIYPASPILELARRMNVPLTLSDDSHGVSSVGGGLDACLRAAVNAGYEQLHYFTHFPEGASAPMRHNPALQLCAVDINEVRPRVLSVD